MTDDDRRRPREPGGLDDAQHGLGDMSPDEFREAGTQVVRMAAAYIEGLRARRVLPDVRPGDVARALPASPPDGPEPLDTILRDYATLIEPNVTHWQHPRFLAYFPSVASGPGILGEILAAALNSNVMFWRNAPASTELEERVCDWLRQMVGLPDVFEGMLTDTASTSSLTAVVAARHAAQADSRTRGLAGRNDCGPLTLYRSAAAHSSIDKAAIVTGIGLENVRAIETDGEDRMRPDRLEEAIAKDRAAGLVPVCVVATLGTTVTTSVDPAEDVAAVCEREGVWLHVDAAYAGVAAVLPECADHFRGWARADSIVINPHKWLFTPFDASLLLFRDSGAFRKAFSLVPDYLETPEADVRNFHEYGIPLGRRFRALKLWMLIRYFGVDGIARRLRDHCARARAFASWIESEPAWELAAPVPFATVCFRHRPPGLEGDALDAHNAALLERVNRDGRVYLSGAPAGGRFAIRVSIGNPRTTDDDLDMCRAALRDAVRG